MIVVVGRAGLDGNNQLDGAAALVAVAAAHAGAKVELVGAISDDAGGERVALELGKAGVGHAALLRNPSGGPRVDPSDLELGLAYLTDYAVIVVADQLEPAALEVVQSAARFQGATLVVVLAAGSATPAAVDTSATVLEAPSDDNRAFSALVGRYAAGLDRGDDAAAAWRKALAATGWESAANLAGD